MSVVTFCGTYIAEMYWAGGYAEHSAFRFLFWTVPANLTLICSQHLSFVVKAVLKYRGRQPHIVLVCLGVRKQLIAAVPMKLASVFAEALLHFASVRLHLAAPGLYICLRCTAESQRRQQTSTRRPPDQAPGAAQS